MTEKNSKTKIPTDFDNIENPGSDHNMEVPTPDAWVKPEMLRRLSDRDFGENEYLDVPTE